MSSVCYWSISEEGAYPADLIDITVQRSGDGDETVEIIFLDSGGRVQLTPRQARELATDLRAAAVEAAKEKEA